MSGTRSPLCTVKSRARLPLVAAQRDRRSHSDPIGAGDRMDFAVHVADPRNLPAVVESQAHRRSHGHFAVQSDRDADHVRGIRPGRHEVDDPRHASRGRPVRFENDSVSGVPARGAGGGLGGRECPVTGLVIAQESGERGGRVETGQAEPVDGPSGAHQCCRVQVRQQSVVLDFCHGRNLFYGMGGCGYRVQGPGYEVRDCGRLLVPMRSTM
jgi:hypothetical protein